MAFVFSLTPFSNKAYLSELLLGPNEIKFNAIYNVSSKR